MLLHCVAGLSLSQICRVSGAGSPTKKYKTCCRRVTLSSPRASKTDGFCCLMVCYVSHSGLFSSERFSRLGEFRPIARSYLTAILEFLLTALIANSFLHHSVPAEELVSVLEHQHEVKRDVTKQVMAWFGEFRDGAWKIDVDATVKEVGLGILWAYKVYCIHTLAHSTSSWNPARMIQYPNQSLWESGVQQ